MRISTLFSALVFCFTLAAQVPDVPASRVTDTTGTLQPQQIEALSTKLKALEDKSGTQILVYMTGTTNGMPIEDYGIQVARKWKPGQKKDNNGAILLIAKNDRKMRIEVGRGLEGVMTDTVTKGILDNTLRPNFRSGNFYGGIDQAVTQLIGLASKEAFVPPTPAQKAAAVAPQEDSSGWYWFIGFIVLAGGIGLAVWGYSKHKREQEEEEERVRAATRRRLEADYEERLRSQRSASVVVPVSHNHHVAAAAAVGLGAGIAAAQVAKKTTPKRSDDTPHRSSSSYDYGSSSRSSSSSSSSSGSSSSWSSGGGSFDGGGSSGDW